MWKEIAPPRQSKWPDGVRLPIIISVHHQSEEAAVVFEDGRADPFDFSERQYGGRRGAWRLLEMLERHGILGTWIVCGATLEKYPEISRAAKKAGHSFAGHTYAHEMMCNYPPEEELALVHKTVSVFEDVLGERLRGWRTCFASHHTIDILLEHFAFDWDASMWNDDLPYVIEGHGRRLLEIPFSAYSDAALAIQITNPAPVNPFCTWHSNTPSFIFHSLKAQFDALYERGAERAVLMPLSVHDFILGRPSRSKALEDFLDYAKQFAGVVFTTHDVVSQWWWKNYADEKRPSERADASATARR
ncbi:MAG TPA: polysaccharide deacetylase family protein [Xanthobacteraceae bacterium]|nr:polysaccharide deacetylase family protein [Xanthobacteraceae bacterium]